MDINKSAVHPASQIRQKEHSWNCNYFLSFKVDKILEVGIYKTCIMYMVSWNINKRVYIPLVDVFRNVLLKCGNLPIADPMLMLSVSLIIIDWAYWT